MGAYIEFVYNELNGSGKQFDFADYAKAIRYVGVDPCILSSDMGQPKNLCIRMGCWRSSEA
jgi:hypothetical protein